MSEVEIEHIHYTLGSPKNIQPALKTQQTFGLLEKHLLMDSVALKCLTVGSVCLLFSYGGKFHFRTVY
jgi:hypothetical protein